MCASRCITTLGYTKELPQPCEYTRDIGILVYHDYTFSRARMDVNVELAVRMRLNVIGTKIQQRTVVFVKFLQALFYEILQIGKEA